jgi:hypothetical protein
VKLSCFLLSFVIWLIFIGFNSFGKTLDLPSASHPDKSTFMFGWHSDLFIDPFETKGAAFKAYRMNADFPVLKSYRLEPLINVRAESTSIAQPGLTVGNSEILINKAVLYRGVGLGLMHSYSANGYVKFTAVYESASDEPFLKNRDKNFDINLHIISAENQSGQWIVIINSSNNRGYLNGKTIPLVGYKYFYNDQLNAAIGLIGFFELEWMVTSDDALVVSADPVSYFVRHSKKLPLELIWLNQIGLATQSFLHSERVEDDMRLFLEYKYMKTGFELDITKRSKLAIDFGLVYDRTLYEAKQVFLPIGKEEIFASEWFGSFTWRFQL